MTPQKKPVISDVIGKIPNRMALAGGWIDQPFISKLNPDGIGSMVVVALEPTFRVMDRCGMSTSTRAVAMKLWNRVLPEGNPEELVRRLYHEENKGKAEPSGSQDMAGLVYPGINRLDYDATHEGGYFPKHVESNNDPATARWLESVLHVIPVAQRPEGYNPLGVKNLDPHWISRLGRSGKDCYSAIIRKDIHGVGASMNECMKCWEAILPHTVRHPALTVDLMGLLDYYQSAYAGAMYSGCGGGYLYVLSEKDVPGSFSVTIRIAR
jgi:hypothetical protein